MSWLPRDRDPAAFDRACRVGFLIASDMHARAFGRFEAWCRQHGRPPDLNPTARPVGGHRAEDGPVWVVSDR